MRRHSSNDITRKVDWDFAVGSDPSNKVYFQTRLPVVLGLLNTLSSPEPVNKGERPDPAIALGV